MTVLTESARSAISRGKGLALNLGAGRAVRDGFLNIDILSLETTDILADLNEGLPMIPDCSVESVYSRHALEHISRLDRVLEEIMRVCVNGATVQVIVPHYSNPFGYSDPTHSRFFGIYSFCYFSRDPYFERRKSFPCYNENVCFAIDDVKLSFYRLTGWDRIFVPRLEKWLNARPGRLEFYEYRLSGLLPAHEIEFVLRVVK